MSETPEHGPVLMVPGATRTAFRNSILICIVVGVVGLVVGGLVSDSALLLAAFGCFGLLLGAANNLLVQRSVLRQSAADLPSKAALLRGVGARLALITALAVLATLLFFPHGLGTFLGLAVFQAINTIVGAVPALKELRQ